jgi:predicted nucleic acid-binding protein
MILNQPDNFASVLRLCNKNKINLVTSKSLIKDLSSKIEQLVKKNYLNTKKAEVIIQGIINIFDIKEESKIDYQKIPIPNHRYLNLIMSSGAKTFVCQNYDQYSILDGFQGKINVIEQKIFLRNICEWRSA